MVQTDLRAVSKRFFTLYYPVYLVIMITNITVAHNIGFNPWGVTLTSKIIYFNVHMMILFFAFIMVRILIRLKSIWVWILYFLCTLLFTEFLFSFLKIFILPFFTDPMELNAFDIKTTVFLRSSNSVSFLFLFFLAERAYWSEKRFQAEQAKRLKNEKKLIESQLKLLQAQTEPHFLFNTLTAVGTSYEANIEKGRRMLDSFIKYLRSSLDQTRKEKITVKHETDLLTAYLDIFCARLGKRLRYKINYNEDIAQIEFPSMLIQPLVENAIKHGIEPKIEGGEISIHVEKKEDLLCWVIADTGLGLDDIDARGDGLTIIEDRIEALFGSKGKVSFQENVPCGVRVIVEVPID